MNYYQFSNFAMMRLIRARYSNGIIIPLEDLELKEGEEVRITISSVAKGGGLVEALRSTAGGWKDLIDTEELKRNIYRNRKTVAFCDDPASKF